MLRLKFSCAIITYDEVAYNSALREVYKKRFEELEWLLGNSLKDIRDTMGSHGRHLMVSALAASIQDNDDGAVTDILDFSNEKRIIIHIDVTTIEMLNESKNFDMMRRLLKAFVQFRRPIKRIVPTNLKKDSEGMESTRSDTSGNADIKERHLRLSDFIHCIYEWR